MLSWARLALNNAIATPEVLAALSQYNYDEARLQEGIVLLGSALDLHAEQKDSYGKQYAATQALHQAWKMTDQPYYAVHRRLARHALKHDQRRKHALTLTVRKRTSFRKWLDQASVFYSNALDDPEIITAFEGFNITHDNLIEAQTALAHVEALKMDQDREMGNARQATRDRDAVFKELDTWLNTFREVARIALSNQPERLEALELGPIPLPQDE